VNLAAPSFIEFKIKSILVAFSSVERKKRRATHNAKRDTILHLDANKFISPKEFLKKGKRRGK